MAVPIVTIELCDMIGRKILQSEYFGIYKDDPFGNKTFLPNGFLEDCQGNWMEYILELACA